LRKTPLIHVLVLALVSIASVTKADGLINAISFLPMPSSSTITVRPLDNSDRNLVLQKEFELALKNKGYTIGRDEPLILTFDATDISGAWLGGGENRMIEFSNHDDQSGIEAPRIHLNLFNSTRGGILNPNDRDKIRTVTPSSFRIDVSIDEKTNGKRIWQGWSSISYSIGKNFENSRQMIPILVENLGKTLSRKTFPLKP